MNNYTMKLHDGNDWTCHKVVVSDYPSLKEALEYVKELSNICERDSSGVINIYIQNMDDFIYFPKYLYRFHDTGELVPDKSVVSEDEFYISEEWDNETYKDLIESCCMYRVEVFYCDRADYIDELHKQMFQHLVKTMPPKIEWKFIKIKGVDEYE